jgi:hypothetical protein
VGLGQLDRRHTQLALQGATKVAVAHPELARELRNPTAIERAGANPMRGHLRQAGHGIDQRSSRSQLRPAAETGPEPRLLGRCGRFEEPPPLVIRHPGRADRPAVDPRRGNADEEDAIEARVPRVQRALADFRVQQGSAGGGACHVLNLEASPQRPEPRRLRDRAPYP